MPWYVLAHTNEYLGQRWEVFNASLRRPRTAMVDLQHATKCSSLSWAEEEARRGKAILGVDFLPLEITIKGHGKDARVVLA